MEIFIPGTSELLANEEQMLKTPGMREEDFLASINRMSDALSTTAPLLKRVLHHIESMKGNALLKFRRLIGEDTFPRTETAERSVFVLSKGINKYHSEIKNISRKAYATKEELKQQILTITGSSERINSILRAENLMPLLQWNVPPDPHPPQSLSHSLEHYYFWEWRENALRWASAIKRIESLVSTWQSLVTRKHINEEQLLGFLAQTPLLQLSRLPKHAITDEKRFRVRPKSQQPNVSNAVETSEWWTGLSKSGRAWHLKTRHETVGNLPGVPYEARHEANVETLRKAIERKSSLTPKQRAVADELIKILSKEEEISTHIVALDLNQKVPFVAVAYGDPDTADNISWLVPGMFSDSNQALAEWDQAARKHYLKQKELLDVSGRADSSSVIIFQEYDTPNLISVLGTKSAAAGAERLVEELNGTYALKNIETRVGAIGHSYGTTVLSLALTSGKLDRNLDFVDLKASAGMAKEVANYDDFQVSENEQGTPNIYTTLAVKDWIAPFGSFISGRVQPNSGTASNFLHGAQEYSSDGFEELKATGGHPILTRRGTGYLDEDSLSLLNSAAIAVGESELMKENAYRRPTTGYMYEAIRDF